MTKADKIRSMTDEALVNIVRCPANIDGDRGDLICDSKTCDECKYQWLKKDVKNETNNFKS